MTKKPSYAANVLDTHRFQYCPKCTAELVEKVLFDDNILRVTCPECGWIQLMNSAAGVAVVACKGEQIAIIEPPGEDGVALPAGLVEYGEDPKEAAVREVLEETGLKAKIMQELGWFFMDQSEWPGPILYFMYEAQIIGGTLQGSDEGAARLVPRDKFPQIATGRHGSRRAIKTYFAKFNST